MLTEEEFQQSADSIEKCQLKNGMILWFEGGHSDPWNHVEAAMALSIAGRTQSAERAYSWLASNQLPDGSWWNYYVAEGIKDYRIDTNVCAYPAVGIWQHFAVVQDRAFLESCFPMVEKAINFVLGFASAGGEILWCKEPDGTVGKYALLTGSSSIALSIRAAIAIAREIGMEVPDWELALSRLSETIQYRPESFEPKKEYAMDWYYPVLCGVLQGAGGKEHLDSSWDAFVFQDKGVRCVSNRPWVTAAETAECALALNAIGIDHKAIELLDATYAHRQDDGSYLTGIVYPEKSTFPYQERSTYTAAAVMLADYALRSDSLAAGLFRGVGLPEIVKLSDPLSDPA